MGKQLFEFMTHWDSPRPIWFKRDEEALIGTQRSGGRPMPPDQTLRPGQGIHKPPGGPAAGVVAGPGRRHRGPIPWTARSLSFTARPITTCWCSKFTGNAAAETEYGEYHLSPGHSMHLPAGVAYRMLGAPGCRQLVVKVHKPVRTTLDPNNPLTETGVPRPRRGRTVRPASGGDSAARGPDTRSDRFLGLGAGAPSSSSATTPSSWAASPSSGAKAARSR